MECRGHVHRLSVVRFGIEHRAGYLALLESAFTVPRPFDVIVVEDLSRLTRDMSEILRLYHRLRLREIELVGVGDGIATGRRGAKTQLAVKGLVNELYLDDLRDKTHAGAVWQRGPRPQRRGSHLRVPDHPVPARRDVQPAEQARSLRYRARGGRGGPPHLPGLRRRAEYEDYRPRAQRGGCAIPGQGHEAGSRPARVGALDDPGHPPKRTVCRRVGVEQDALPEGPRHWAAPASAPAPTGVGPARARGFKDRRAGALGCRTRAAAFR